MAHVLTFEFTISTPLSGIHLFRNCHYRGSYQYLRQRPISQSLELTSAMNSIVTEEFTLLGIALGVIILTTHCRLTTVGIRSLQADDYLMIVAAVR